MLLVFLLSILHQSSSLFNGIKVKNALDGAAIDMGEILTKTTSSSPLTLVVLSTYAADFNNIEYGQRLRYYLPELKKLGVLKSIMVINAAPQAIRTFSEQIDLPSSVLLISDSEGAVGKSFGVSRGFRPEDSEMNPYLKLFAMLWGLGAWATLPAVISGYVGNPFSTQPWIESALAQGQSVGRWPNNALDIETASNGSVVVKTNMFATLPLVGGWGRRPLELATLRLQNMVGVSLANWEALRPSEEELRAGVLTQLGGCLLLDKDMKSVYEWRDAGICHVAKFEDIIAAAATRKIKL